MCAFLKDLFRTCDCTDQTSCVVFDILWRFLHWALGLNKPSRRRPRKGPAEQPSPGPAVAAQGGRGRAGRLRAAAAGLGSHTHLGLLLFSKSLPAYHSLCYTATQETFPPIIPKVQGSFQSGTRYQLTLVFSLCANCAVLMTTVIG